MRYRLRTLLIVLALGPVAIAAVWFAAFERTSDRAIIGQVLATVLIGVLTLAGLWTIFDAMRG